MVCVSVCVCLCECIAENSLQKPVVGYPSVTDVKLLEKRIYLDRLVACHLLPAPLKLLFIWRLANMITIMIIVIVIMPRPT